MSKRILVAYASGTGSTAEVAEAIGEVLAQGDVPVQVSHVKDVTDVRSYSAVVLGSSIRLGRWLPDAINFLETYKDEMKNVPVAYFTTCLILAEESEESRSTALSYMEPVRQMAPQIEPIGLGLFAGSLDPGRSMVAPAGPYGDYRDWDAIRAWAAEIRPALLASEVPAHKPMVLGEAILSYTDMSGANLREFDLRRAELHETKLREANLQGADLRETDLTKADLEKADLHEAGLSWAELRRSNMRGANLNRANLMGANLRQADLSEADLSQAILNGANLHRATLRGANLTNTDLNWADLSSADLSQANLSEASVGWANLSAADLNRANLNKTRYNAQTQWPEDFSPEEAGCVFVGGVH